MKISLSGSQGISPLSRRSTFWLSSRALFHRFWLFSILVFIPWDFFLVVCGFVHHNQHCEDTSQQHREVWTDFFPGVIFWWILESKDAWHSPLNWHPHVQDKKDRSRCKQNNLCKFSKLPEPVFPEQSEFL